MTPPLVPGPRYTAYRLQPTTLRSGAADAVQFSEFQIYGSGGAFETGGTAYAYGVSSPVGQTATQANDLSSHDPVGWQVYGSNDTTADNPGTWELLGTISSAGSLGMLTTRSVYGTEYASE